ncbi:unnamed protein product [Sphagnum jensenii]|uniref:Cilia- and flagella-associated protein 57 n=1 Tax=Sphagnum jensenii TaxID=128206 RepID=A0ABP1AS96_9BRYO
MALASLIPHHIFGLRSNLKNVLYFSDDSTVLYPAGHNLVFWSTDQKNQRIISGSPDTDTISAVAVSANRKQVAIAEYKIKNPVISIYDTVTLKKKKVLSSSEAGAHEYVSLAFSADGKLVLAQGGAPEWNLLAWSLEKQKVIATVKTAFQGSVAYQVQCCPANPSLVTVIGVGFARMYRVTDSALRPVSTGVGKRDNQVFLCHLWLTVRKDNDSDSDQSDKEGDDKVKDGACIYSLNSGDLLYVEGGEIVATIATGEGGGTVAETIVQYSKGFVCGEAGGFISVYSKQDGEDINFKKIQSIKVDNSGVKVRSMALSPNEDLLVFTLENQQLISLPFQSIDMFKANDVPKDLNIQTFHPDAITGMDMCVRRPIIATCGVDKSVRIWNYVDKCCELAKFFTEEVLSISLHPNGLHVLVGFADKLRMMNLLMDDIRMAKEFNIKACGECYFSNGGQYFAAVQSNAVHIFETYTCNNLGNLRAHSGKVRSISWSADDNFLFTAGIDGAIYEWEVKSLKRTRENVIKGCMYSCVVNVKDCKTFFAVGSDRKLKELDDTMVVKSYTSAIVLTQITLPFGSRLFFAGTELGSIRAYRYPLSGDYYEVQACSASIARICVSCDATLLACAGEDGVLMLFDIRDKERSLTQGAAKKEKEALGWANEVLVSRSEVEELRQTCQDLETKVAEVATYCEYQIKVKEQEFLDRMKEVTDACNHQLEESQLKMEASLQERVEKELKLEQKQVQIEENHAQALLDVEDQYQKKIMIEVARYTTLEQDKITNDARWELDTKILRQAHEKALQDLTEAYEEKLDDEKITINQLKLEEEQALKDFSEIRRQHEEDQDKEIEDTKANYENQLVQEKEILLRIKGENGVMKKKFIEFQKDIEEQREEIKILFQQKKELYEIIAIFERDMAGLKKDIQERDDTIGEKEKRIFELKRKNQELEKFKFVLDYKIKDFKQQMEPRELELQESKEQISKMEVELGRSHTSIGKKDLTLAELRLKLEGMVKEERILRRTIAHVSEILKHFQHDFYELAQLIQDPTHLKVAVIEMFDKYVKDNVIIVPIDKDYETENARQRDFLERTVANLKYKLSKELEVHHSSHLKILEENICLIKELNELRREIKLIKLFHKPFSNNAGPSRTTRDGMANSPHALDITTSSTLSLEHLASMQSHVHEIVDLKAQVQGLELELATKEERITYLEGIIREHEMVHLRPKSRHELPPMAGISEGPS